MSIQPFRILIFDSGVGGLSVQQAIKIEFDRHDDFDNHYIYFADHQAAPYGNKKDDWLAARIESILVSLGQEYAPDVIVLACNTASTLVLDRLRRVLTIPIIGVVPAIKTAAELARQDDQKSIGLLATPATVQRSYIDDLHQQFAAELALIRVGATELVTLAEQKMAGQNIDSSVLTSILTPFNKAKCQHVVLGCTHFPLLRPELSSISPDIQWIDSGHAIAQRTQFIKSELGNKRVDLVKPVVLSHHFISSAEISAALAAQVRCLGFTEISVNRLGVDC